VLYQLMTKQLKALADAVSRRLTRVTLVIDQTTYGVQTWELLEDGPQWILDVQLVPGPRWFHAGETVTVLIPGPGTTLEGRVVAANSGPRSQRLVIKGLGSTYVQAP
jgi:hypothetical protein